MRFAASIALACVGLLASAAEKSNWAELRNQIERTLHAAEGVRASNWPTVGQLMYASHASLRDDYEVSCPEVDTLVELACEQDGVYGSRITGGGFGGCTISLVQRSQVEEFGRSLAQRYEQATGGKSDIYIFQASDGAREALQ